MKTRDQAPFIRFCRYCDEPLERSDFAGGWAHASSVSLGRCLSERMLLQRIRGGSMPLPKPRTWLSDVWRSVKESI